MAHDICVTLAQLNPTVGDIEGNAEQILTAWRDYDAKSDIIIFPELFLSGYPPEDLVFNTAFLEQLEGKLDDLRVHSREFQSAALIPTITRKGNHIYNAAILIENGEVIDYCAKHELPNYAVFDELRTFSSAPLSQPLEFRGHKLGILICEDLWHPAVSAHLKNQGAEILIALNGSPYHTEQHDSRKAIAAARISENTLPLVYLNMIGGQDELVFDGRSFVANSDGEMIYTAPAFQENIFQINIHASKALFIPEQTEEVELRPEPLALLYKALVTGLKDYVHKNGFKDVLIGLSGGVDSALTAALAVDAFGARHVHCVMLPSDFTSDESLQDAKDCADALDVRYDIIPIKQAMTTFEDLIPDLSGLAHENTQSRIRGSILMALSNMTGAMLITTGNKSEMAVGYCTLYGDMNGGYNALKDVYKTKVYELCRWRNGQGLAIPENIIKKAPSAELRPDQKDADSLPDYDLLDDILRLLVEYDDIVWENATEAQIAIYDKCLQHPHDVQRIARLLKITEYKRYQAPPGTRVTRKAFGRDRRYPMTNGFTNRVAT